MSKKSRQIFSHLGPTPPHVLYILGQYDNEIERRGGLAEVFYENTACADTLVLHLQAPQPMPF